jgi:hypothetical protein
MNLPSSKDDLIPEYGFGSEIKKDQEDCFVNLIVLMYISKK